MENQWQRAYTMGLIGLWLLCGVGMGCRPDWYFALFGAALFAGGIRGMLFRSVKLSIGADRSWEADRFGAFSFFATGLACLAGYFSADMTTERGVLLTLWYNVFVLLFSVGAIPFALRDWRTHLACLSKAVAWRNVLGRKGADEEVASNS
jgi:hypothetical protein